MLPPYIFTKANCSVGLFPTGHISSHEGLRVVENNKVTCTDTDLGWIEHEQNNQLNLLHIFYLFISDWDCVNWFKR